MQGGETNYWTCPYNGKNHENCIILHDMYEIKGGNNLFIAAFFHVCIIKLMMVHAGVVNKL